MPAARAALRRRAAARRGNCQSARVKQEPRHDLAMHLRAAQKVLSGFGAAEVEMGVVLPGKPDSAVKLDQLARRVDPASEALALAMDATSQGNSGPPQPPRRRQSRRPTCRLDLEQKVRQSGASTPGKTRLGAHTARAA